MAARLRSILALLLSIGFLAACSSRRPIGTPFPEGYTLVSERIEVRTKAGEVITSKRIEVRNDSVYTDRQVIDLLEVESITEKRFSPGKSYLLVGGAALAALGVVMVFVMVEVVSRAFVYVH